MFADTRLVVDESGCECDSKLKWVYVKFISLIVTNCHDFCIWYVYFHVGSVYFLFPQENDFVIVQSTIPIGTFFKS